MSLVCYLDDSGTNKESQVVTMAGYIAPIGHWEEFENEAQLLLKQYNVKFIHAIDLHATKGEFKNWSINKKEQFLKDLYDIFRIHVGFGISQSVLHDKFTTAKIRTGLSHSQSPYGFCFNVILSKLLEDERIKSCINDFEAQLSFVIEAGNKNNKGLLKSFHNIQKQYQLEKLTSILFIGKQSCIAIQMADLIAFFSHRHTQKVHFQETLGKDRNIPHDRYLSIILDRVNHIDFFANDGFS